MRHSHNRMGLRRSGKLILAIATAGFFLAACGGGKPSAVTTRQVHRAIRRPPLLQDGSTTVPRTGHDGPVHRRPAPRRERFGHLGSVQVPSSAKEWDIDWVYYCTSSPTTVGTFQITVVGHGSTANTTDAGVTEPRAGDGRHRQELRHGNLQSEGDDDLSGGE